MSGTQPRSLEYVKIPLSAGAMVAAAVLGATAAYGDKAAHPEKTDECIAAAEQAQPLQREGKLQAAREHLPEGSPRPYKSRRQCG